MWTNLDFVHSVHTLENMSTGYVSGRVPARYERLVTKQARAARTSKSDLVARYVIEKSIETEFPGISFRDSLSGREACETGEARLTVIDRDITLEGSLGEDQRARLLAIANRCPVHLTLTSRIDIRTRLQLNNR